MCPPRPAYSCSPRTLASGATVNRRGSVGTSRPGLLRDVPTEARLFMVAPEARVLGVCHWQPDCRTRPTLVLIHGLEGCSESHYMRGIAAKAWRAGLNIVRMNQRNCGGT